MAALLTVRWMVAGYLVEAERVGTWRWLGTDGYDHNNNNNHNHNNKVEVLVTKFGDEVIAALVVAGVVDAGGNVRRSSSGGGGGGGGGGGKKGHRSNNSGGAGAATANGTAKIKAVIRAWTVRQKYRRKGVGAALLEEAVKLCRHKRWSGPVFAADHANSARVLPGLFNAGFEARERRAREMLERVVNVEMDLKSSSNDNGNGNGGKGGRGRRR
ncbi:hypothetical protein GJ744_002320 [Endocarpon pusillum]|uniref:N-acetyltransferase domain-containing protein n=1 Tax=Endocarpon pusillum TaxID=364733 RepID=A0A8H7E8I2_9EURO|nr:hypothetical protein GJ744_002320 [Endocarpon pusillum]